MIGSCKVNVEWRKDRKIMESEMGVVKNENLPKYRYMTKFCTLGHGHLFPSPLLIIAKYGKCFWCAKCK